MERKRNRKSKLLAIVLCTSIFTGLTGCRSVAPASSIPGLSSIPTFDATQPDSENQTVSITASEHGVPDPAEDEEGKSTPAEADSFAEGTSDTENTQDPSETTNTSDPAEDAAASSEGSKTKDDQPSDASSDKSADTPSAIPADTSEQHEENQNNADRTEAPADNSSVEDSISDDSSDPLPSDTPTPIPTDTPTPTPVLTIPPSGLTKSGAINAAKSAVQDNCGWHVDSEHSDPPAAFEFNETVMENQQKRAEYSAAHNIIGHDDFPDTFVPLESCGSMIYWPEYENGSIKWYALWWDEQGQERKYADVYEGIYAFAEYLVTVHAPILASDEKNIYFGVGVSYYEDNFIGETQGFQYDPWEINWGISGAYYYVLSVYIGSCDAFDVATGRI